MIPASGSAYTYSYVVFGELIAWMIGVALILEYTLGGQRGRGRLVGLCRGVPEIGRPRPARRARSRGRSSAASSTFPAIFIIWVVAGLLIAGTRESATLNAILVVIKMLALALFVAVALPVFNAAHFHPFMPYGFPQQRAVRAARSA